MRQTLHDLATFAARLGVGGIFFANGWHKLEAGLTATGDQFATLGAPVPGAWAATTMLMELIGGALLVAGLAVPACGLLLFAEAVAVFVVASGEQGLPLTGGDVNLIVALGAASILLAVGGAGRLSVDHMVVIKRREAEAAEDFAADTEADDVIAALREPESGDLTREGPAQAEKPVRREDPAQTTRTGKTPRAEKPARDGRVETSETGKDTAEFPAVPARPRRSTTSEQGATSRPGKDADALVAGRKTESAED
ncbi:DoxX family protein [Streptosporangium sp. NBC_01756]|uniref:DoxX family protein n=1 Tax=Streptosporangium sp. NBC_01756 TaxID=2975950 RepID=UPI002DD8868E|nr:DoxX family protein [Streptosporangium sp. NBC_01756]WSC88052.1 DoxX family protein [Streptosporangium sp. NBC_01756]